MSLSIPNRVFVARLLPGPPISIAGGSKHTRPAFCPDDGLFYNCGGDWNDLSGEGSGQQQMYAVDVVNDIWGRVVTGSCGGGGVYPAHPDQVVWCWDTSRRRFFYTPGFESWIQTGEGCGFAIAATRNNGGNIEIETTQDNNYQVGDIIAVTGCDGNGATFDGNIWRDGNVNIVSLPGRTITNIITVRRFVINSPYITPDGTAKGNISPRLARYSKAMRFDPALGQRTWVELGPAPFPVAEQSGNHGGYDNVLDVVWRGRGAGLDVQRISMSDLSEQTFTVPVSTNGLSLTTESIGSEYTAVDPVGRHAYMIEPYTGHLHIFHLDTHTVTSYNTPVNTNDGNIDDYQRDCAYPIWNSVSNVLMWPYVRNFSTGCANASVSTGSIRMFVFDPTKVIGSGLDQSQAWEEIAIVSSPAGIDVRGNAWGFSHDLNCMIGWGGHPGSGGGTVNQYMFLFRYAAAPPGGSAKIPWLKG